jgi:hypothetical protein
MANVLRSKGVQLFRAALSAAAGPARVRLGSLQLLARSSESAEPPIWPLVAAGAHAAAELRGAGESGAGRAVRESCRCAHALLALTPQPALSNDEEYSRFEKDSGRAHVTASRERHAATRGHATTQRPAGRPATWTQAH